MTEFKTAQTVAVTGDITIDWQIARIRRSEGAVQGWNPDDVTRSIGHYGGAAMLSELLMAVSRQLKTQGQSNFKILQADLPLEKITTENTGFPHSYTLWEPFKKDDRSDQNVWRVREFLGLNQEANGNPCESLKVSTGAVSPDLVVISDANLGFRSHPDCWPEALTSAGHPWVLTNTYRPVAQGALWEYLYEHHCDKLICVTAANDLRSEQIQVSRHLSWERTAQDLLWELTHNPSINRLSQCAHIIISFGPSGAILFSRGAGAKSEATLIYDPVSLEGEWIRRYPGSMIGYNSCLVAGIAREIILNSTQPDICRGVQSGLRAMRYLHIEGCGPVTSDANRINLQFPADGIALELAKAGNCLPAVNVRNPSFEKPQDSASTSAPSGVFWTILQDRYPGSLESLAEKIVLEGLENSLPEVPVGKFGNLKTTDRREIEALNSISSLIQEYVSGEQKTPVSIAVFGPPGSGKSFSVKEVANSAAPGKIVSVSFNLSQFGSPEELFDAFHQVRDKVLSGKIPLVFWDEFDNALNGQSLGWLRYFLAPMQDGEFQQGQIVHPLGRSIFVFAGGTSHTLEEFGANLMEDQQRAVKLPDFVSRLKGFLNILGPNPQIDNKQGNPSDPYYIVRRALLLRSIFERLEPRLFRIEGKKKILAIDRGILRAFLFVETYKHGARSMESVVAMSRLTGKTQFERSCLPSEEQLNLHVDGRRFAALVNRLELTSEILEKLAQAYHEIFCEKLVSKGYRYNPITSEEYLTHCALKPFAELSEYDKQQNRLIVRDIQSKLDSVGYIMLPNRNHAASVMFQPAEIEKLAIMEHQRWVQQKIQDGWEYASVTDKTARKHKDMVLWDQLSEDAKEKDRDMVRAIPDILSRAGYTIQQVH